MLVHGQREAHEHGCGQCVVFKRSALRDLTEHRGRPALRNFLRAVGGDLVNAVLQVRVAKTLNQRVAVICPVGATQVRRNFVAHQLVHKFSDVRQANTTGNEGSAGDGPHERHGRVAAVEHAQLGLFVAVHIARHAHTGALQQGRVGRVGKAVFDHPFPKTFGAQGAVVLQAQRLLRGGHHLGGGGRHDAVDHAARESALRVQPAQQLGVLRCHVFGWNLGLDQGL